MHKLQIIQIKVGLAPPGRIQGDRRSNGHCMLWHHHIQPQRLPVHWLCHSLSAAGCAASLSEAGSAGECSNYWGPRR